jgi:hypothetical protein
MSEELVKFLVLVPLCLIPIVYLFISRWRSDNDRTAILFLLLGTKNEEERQLQTSFSYLLSTRQGSPIYDPIPVAHLKRFYAAVDILKKERLLSVKDLAPRRRGHTPRAYSLTSEGQKKAQLLEAEQDASKP